MPEVAKVVVLGAGGEMGRVAARTLADNEAIGELVLADLDAGRIAPVAADLGERRAGVQTVACDVLDEVAIRRLLDDATLVVGCAGPFFRVGVPTLRAAIDTATTYLDICDDPEPTIEMLRLDGAAREAGVAAVVGMGASPGLSNLLAARAARGLDTVHDCITGWSLDDTGSDGADAERLVGPRGVPTGAVIHFMEQIHATVPVVEDGELVQRAPLGAVEIDYPGLGCGTGYVVGHPEPVTLHRSLGVTGRSCNLVLVRDGSTAAFLRGLQRDLDAGVLDLEQAGRALLSPSVRRSATALATGVRLRGSGPLPQLFAWARGTAGDRELTVGCHVTAMPPGMAGATSIPAALAVDQLLHTPPAPGVHPPETVIDGDRLLTDLLPYCVAAPADLDSLAPVSSADARGAMSA